MSVEAHKLLAYLSPHFASRCDQIQQLHRVIVAHRARIVDIEKQIEDLRSKIRDETELLREQYSKLTDSMHDTVDIAMKAIEEAEAAGNEE